MFERITGHECTACGCEDSAVVAVRTWRGLKMETRACDHCGKQFTQPADGQEEQQQAADPVPAKVVLDVLRCPDCGAKRPPVTKTRSKRLRSHKCKECGFAFQSVEPQE